MARPLNRGKAIRRRPQISEGDTKHLAHMAKEAARKGDEGTLPMDLDAVRTLAKSRAKGVNAALMRLARESHGTTLAAEAVRQLGARNATRELEQYVREVDRADRYGRDDVTLAEIAKLGFRKTTPENVRVSISALRALARKKDGFACTLLFDAATHSPYPTVKKEAITQLVGIRTRRSSEELSHILLAGDPINGGITPVGPELRALAAKELGTRGYKDAAPQLQANLLSEEPVLQATCARALAQIKAGPPALRTLERAIRETRARVKRKNAKKGTERALVVMAKAYRELSPKKRVQTKNAKK